MKIAEEVYSVTRLTQAIRRLVEDGLPPLWVEGEISNYVLHRSGHRYFTMKDSGAQLSCMMWRTRTAPGFELTDGLRVRSFGRVTVWEQGGRYQLDVQSVLPVGIGPLQAAFEELKRKLAAEGLFDLNRKRSLPGFPRAIGIATSPTGAAIRDLVWGFSTRYPPAELYLIPVSVQGEGAAEEIAVAIEAFNRLGMVDLIVVGRGGGSLEDLWAFNEERLVRAVAESGVPVVSAVGHEIDITLCDLAADLRAPTPTAASSLVVPDRQELKASLAERASAIYRALERTVSTWRERISSISGSYGIRQVVGRIAGERMQLDEMARRLEAAIIRTVAESGRRLEAIRLQLSALSPDQVLDRGFCVATRMDGVVVKSGDDIAVGGKLDLRFKHGGALAAVEEVRSDGS